VSKVSVISSSVVGEVAYLRIRGRIVHGEGAAAAVQRAIFRCAASYFSLLVVDLCGVDLMDAAGLSALVVAYSAAQALGSRFELRNVPPRISQLLTVTRLDAIFLPAESAQRRLQA
jgi:anti-sigma B factor antagonist